MTVDPNLALLSQEDAALLQAVLVTGDPEGTTERARLVCSAPPIIVQRYDVAPPGGEERDYVWCGHCGRLTHWKGYVVELPDGVRATLGHNCGKRQFGFEFGAVENEFNAQVDRQGLLRRLLKVRALGPTLRANLHGLSGSTLTRAFDDDRAALASAWPTVWRSLRSASGAGRLVTRTVVPDPEEAARQKQSIRRYYETQMQAAPTKTARERMRKEMQTTLSDVRNVTREVTRDHGVLRGVAFIQLQGTLEAGWQRLHARSRQICNAADAPSGDLTVAALRKLSRDTSDLLDECTALSDCLDSYDAFWKAENLNRVVSWWGASAHAEPILQASGGGLKDEWGTRVRPSSTAPAAPASSSLSQLKADWTGQV